MMALIWGRRRLLPSDLGSAVSPASGSLSGRTHQMLTQTSSSSAQVDVMLQLVRHSLLPSQSEFFKSQNLQRLWNLLAGRSVEKQEGVSSCGGQCLTHLSVFGVPVLNSLSSINSIFSLISSNQTPPFYTFLEMLPLRQQA